MGVYLAKSLLAMKIWLSIDNLYSAKSSCARELTIKILLLEVALDLVLGQNNPENRLKLTSTIDSNGY